MGEGALSPRALIAAGGVMWLTLLMTSFYQTAKLEAQIRVWEDSMMQQLDSIKHEVRIATRARENKHRDVVNEVRSAPYAARGPVPTVAATRPVQVTEGLQQLHHRLEQSNNEVARRLEQVGSVRRAQRSLRTVSQQAATALDSLGKVRPLFSSPHRGLPSFRRPRGSGAELAPGAAGQQGPPPLHPLPHHHDTPLPPVHTRPGGRPAERGACHGAASRRIASATSRPSPASTSTRRGPLRCRALGRWGR